MKKGFTLIELLAVIVILAIIATIATPIVLNIIEDAKISSIKSSANSYLNAIELFISKSNLNNTKINSGTYPIMDDGNVCIGIIEENKCIGEIVKIDTSERNVKRGKITIDKKGIEIDYLEINGYVYYKDGDKYKVDNGKKITKKSNNEIIILEDISVPYLTNYRIYGNEINGVGDYDETTGKYKIAVVAKGKNLFDKNTAKKYNAYIPESLFVYAADSTSYVVKCEPNKTYTVSHNNEKNKIFRIAYVTVEENQLPVKLGDYMPAYNIYRGTTEKSLTINTGKNATFIVFQIATTYANEIIETLMVEEGDTATTYEPYIDKEPQIFNIYLDKPLRCVGEICDYIDYESGKVIRYIGENLEILSEPILENIELPKISINDGFSSISIETSVKPSKFSINYYK